MKARPRGRVEGESVMEKMKTTVEWGAA
jgi:hypothetical protein